MRKYLIENGNNLLDFMYDVMDENDIKKLPISEKCATILNTSVKNKSFKDITEEDAEIIIKEFIEPVTYKDIDLLSMDSFYGEVHNCCGKLWLGLPANMKSKIYNNCH